MQLKIDGNKKIEFTAKGISYILDALALRPFAEVNGLINDIINQLKAQEKPQEVGDNDGPKLD